MKLFYYGIGYLAFMAIFAGLGYSFYFAYTSTNPIIFVTVALYLINVVFITGLFIQKRHAKAKLSWIVVMLVLPLIGHIIFIVLGQRFSQRKSIMEYRKKPSFKHEIIKKNRDPLLNKFAVSASRGVYKTQTDFFSTGDKGYEAMFEDMRKARKYIHIQYYIIKPGEIYEEFKKILIDKSQEGVEVRLIVDDFGRWAMPWYEIAILREKGIKVAIFGRVHFPFIASSNGYRTHRKITIVDGEVAHVGGINIANEYANINPYYGMWIDYQVRLRGEIIRSLQLLFLDDWALTLDENINPKPYLALIKPAKAHDSEMVLVESSPEINEPLLQDSIIALINNAKKSIVIVTPYLVPTSAIESALRNAALSGVEVKIFIPGKPDKKTVYVATRTFARELMQYGIKVYEEVNMLIHSKFGIFDGEHVYFGTANLDIRAVYSQFEFVLIGKGKIAQELVKEVANYAKMARELKPKDVRTNRLKERFVRFYINLFSPIM